MHAVPPPDAPDFYILRLPFLGEVRSPLPPSALFLLALAAIAVFIALPYAMSITFHA